jgi:putative ABC transport system permease protein
MAVAMFSLVIFTLVVMSTLNASFDNVLDDTDRVAGGFHIRGQVNYNNPIPDIETALDETGGISRDDFQAIGSFNIAPAEMRDVDESDKVPDPYGGEYAADGAEYKDREWEDLYLVGVDAGYTENVSYEFELMTEDYASKDQVWKALSENPSLAVVSAEMVPSRERDIGDNEIGLVVGEGQFYIQDDVLPDDVYLEVMDPFTGTTQELRVIGVVDIMAGPYAAPVTTSQETVNALAGRSLPATAYRFQVKPERMGDVAELAKNLEKGFLENGMNTEVMAEEVEDYGRINEMFLNLMMAFMALGLIVGIAALGVIAARSVVERRQQIGMLRAIGFRQGMVQFSFLLESSFVSLLGIGLGVALGVALSYEADWGVEGMTTVIPWAQVVLIVAMAYLASLITTFLPAYQAARIYPAEALRYE